MLYTTLRCGILPRGSKFFVADATAAVARAQAADCISRHDRCIMEAKPRSGAAGSWEVDGRLSLQPVEVPSFSPVREAVFVRLRRAILSGELAPGTRLVERELAQQLGVSRTPVREAFRKLEHEGLVDQVGRRNLIVRQHSGDEIREILAIRAALEGLAAELAAAHARPQHLRRFAALLEQMDAAVAAGDTTALARLNEQFNATLYAAAGSRRLSEMLGSLREQAANFARRGYGVPGRAVEAVQEHHRIVEAVAARDGERAAREAREHVRRSEANLLAGLGGASQTGAAAREGEGRPGRGPADLGGDAGAGGAGRPDPPGPRRSARDAGQPGAVSPARPAVARRRSP
jgi:DNA-binding GntR family transcriptional regulator